MIYSTKDYCVRCGFMATDCRCTAPTFDRVVRSDVRLSPSAADAAEAVAWRWKFVGEEGWDLRKARPPHADYPDVICEPLFAHSPSPAGTPEKQLSGAYRCITADQAKELEATGKVSWIEGCGYVVYDDQALSEFQQACSQISNDLTPADAIDAANKMQEYRVLLDTASDATPSPQPEALGREAIEDKFCEAFSNLDEENRVHNGYVFAATDVAIALLASRSASEFVPLSIAGECVCASHQQQDCVHFRMGRCRSTSVAGETPFFECPDRGKDIADEDEPHAIDCSRPSEATPQQPAVAMGQEAEIAEIILDKCSMAGSSVAEERAQAMAAARAILALSHPSPEAPALDAVTIEACAKVADELQKRLWLAPGEIGERIRALTKRSVP